jgi:hypothetical protein
MPREFPPIEEVIVCVLRTDEVEQLSSVVPPEGQIER